MYRSKNVLQNEKLTNKLKSSKWLKDKNGKLFAPENLIDLSDLSDFIDDIKHAIREGDGHIYKDLLDETILEDKNWSVLQRLNIFFKKEEAIDVLIEYLKNREDYYIGEFSDSDKKILIKYSSYLKEELGWCLLDKINNAYKSKIEQTLNAICQKIHIYGKISILNDLTKLSKGNYSAEIKC